MSSVMEILIKAKDEASAVFDKVGGAAEESGSKASEAWAAAGVIMVAAGAAVEGLARAQEDTTFAVDKLSIRTGESADTIRAWGLEISGANDNILEMTDLMDLANRRGLEGKDALQKYALFWDTISDATGESSTELAKAGVSLAAVGVEAGNEGDAMAALGYISNSTTSSISEFLGFVGRTGPKLREMGIGVDDAAALLGILQNEFGMTGRTAIGQFNTAVNSSNGDMTKLLDTLGISADMLDTYRGKVAASADILDKQAAAFDNTRTPVEHLTMLFGNLTSQYGGVIQQAAQLAPLLLAAGPIMWALTAAVGALSTAKLFLAGIAVPAVNAAFLFLAANPIILVIGAIALAVVALALAFQTNFLGIRDIAQNVGAAVANVLAPMAQQFSDIANIVLPLLGAAFDAIGETVKADIALVLVILQPFIDMLQHAADLMQTVFGTKTVTGMGNLGGQIFGGSSGGGVVPAPPTTGGTRFNPITRTLESYASGAWDVASDMLAYIHQGEMVVPAATASTMRAAAVGGFSGGGGGFSGPLVYINNYSGGEKEDERLGRILQRRTR